DDDGRLEVRPERGERCARARAARHAQLRLDVPLGRPAGERVGRSGPRPRVQPMAGPGAVLAPRHRPARLPPAVLVHPPLRPWWWRRRASPSAVGDCGAPYPITEFRASRPVAHQRATATTL